MTLEEFLRNAALGVARGATADVLGMPGIKYADAGSRGQGGGGARNFVVFPGKENKVKILKRD